MNYNYLKTFRILSKLKSFSKTAIALGIAQPAVSRQIKELESQLGVTLFIRDNKSVSLTHSGKSLLTDIAPSLINIELGIKNIIQDHQSLKGQLHVMCPLELGEVFLTPIVTEFKKIYPDVQINISLGRVTDIEEKLLNGEIDIGIGLKASDNEMLLFFKLLEQKSILVTSHKTKVSKKSLREANYIAYIKNDFLLNQYFKENFSKFSYAQAKIGLTLNSHYSIVDFLQKTPDYYAVLPMISNPVINGLKSKKLQKVSVCKTPSTIYLGVVNMDYPSALLNTFTNFIMNHPSKNIYNKK